jgi:Retrotransposon gag protein/Chromo (CHRromatin Organisation MOdifier) domain/gag-polyprotein putative aspartyl protease/Zinc knuckle
MDAQQFATFMQGFTATIQALVQQQQPPQQQQAHGPKIAVKIPSFKGAPGENIMVWLLQVHNLFLAQGIEDEPTRIYYAATGFEDASLHWYLNRVAAAGNAPAFADWTAFATALRTSFQPPNHQQYLRQQLRTLKQIGSVQEYGMKFRNLIGQTTGMGDLDQVAYFIEGLKPATKMEVSYQAPDNLEDAWKLAIKYDTAMFGLGKPKGSSYQHSYSSSSHDTSTPMELDSTEVNKHKYNNNKRERKPFKGNCFICGQQGHISKDCKDRTQPKVTSIEDTIQLPANYNIESTNINNKEQLLTFKGKINGHEAMILLDSGASRNFVDTKFVQGHKLATKDITPLKVVLADGTQKEINKELNIKELRLDTYRTTGLAAQVITLKNYDAILGKPWLHHANPYINWRSNELTFKYGPRTIKIQANIKTMHKPGHHTTTTPLQQEGTPRKEKEEPPSPKERIFKGKERQNETPTPTPEISKLETPPLKQMARRSKPFSPSAQQSTYHQEPSTNIKDIPGIDFAHLMEYWPPSPQIETVLDKRIRKNKSEYLIKWTGQPSHDNTWESLHSLNSLKILDQGKIKDFEMMRTSSF